MGEERGGKVYVTEAKSTRVAWRVSSNNIKGNSRVMEEMETGEEVYLGQNKSGVELVFVQRSK